MEHYAGKWPFWLAPRQIMVVPVGAAFCAYAEWDTSGKTLNNKVRQSQQAGFNYIAVVGDAEMNAFSVNVRQRDIKDPLGVFTIQEFIEKLKSESMPSSKPM